MRPLLSLVFSGLCFAAGTSALGADQPVDVMYAGSLVTVFEQSVGPAFNGGGYTFQGEAKGSVAIANLIRSGLRRPDVFVSADPAVLSSLMGVKNGSFVSWYAVFATTRLVVGYSSTSPFAADFVQVARGTRSLADVLSEPGLRIGRTDPDLDPKGYRTILAMQLLEKSLDKPGLTQRVLGDPQNAAQILPEETLLTRLEDGDLDCAFLYATESLTRHLPAVELPAAANLGDPKLAAAYAQATTTIDGKTYAGAPIAYAITVPEAAPNHAGGEAFVQFLLSDRGQKLLENAGIKIVPPELVGDAQSVPPDLQSTLVQR